MTNRKKDRQLKNLVTPEGLADLKEEYRHLMEVERPQVLEEVNEMRSMGDLKENEAYHQARKKQAMVVGRIEELEQILKNAVVDQKKGKAGQVQLGSRVHLVLGENEEEDYQLVGKDEANLLAGKISITSPLGEKLLGSQVGDEIKIEAPDGELVYKITQVN